MKKEVKIQKILFLVTAIICLIYLIRHFIIGNEYNDTFWIALLWLVMGLYLYKYPAK